MIDLYQGDAIAHLQTLLAQGRGWHYALTSPPYYGLIDYGHGGEYGHEESLGAYLGCLERVFALVQAGMAQGGVLWLNLGPTTSGYSVVRRGGRGGRCPIGVGWSLAIAVGRRCRCPGYCCSGCRGRGGCIVKP